MTTNKDAACRQTGPARQGKASGSRYCRCMYFASGALARKIEKLANESWRKTGLSPSLAYLLMLVLDEPGIQPGGLAAELLLAPSTITRLLEKLEEKKLLHRASEGKITNVYPGAKARSMHPLLKDCLHSFYEHYSAVLGKEESARLVQALNRITDKIGT